MRGVARDNDIMNTTPNLPENENRNGQEASNPKKKKVRILDFVIFAVCFLISCTIWLYVTGIENGEFEYTFNDVVVNIDGASALLNEQGLSLISNQEYKVSITVKGYRREIMKDGADDFFAHVDVDTINGAGTHSMSILAEAPAGNISIISTSPSAVNIFVDETDTKNVPIIPTLRYNIADTLTMYDPVPEVDTIEVVGPKTRIELIEYAKVEYDLGTITASTNFKAPIKLCDSLGNEITNPYIKSSVNEVTVKIKVTEERSFPIFAEFKASDTDKYDYKITFVPETLTLVGDPAVLSKLEKLTANVGTVTVKKNGLVKIDLASVGSDVMFVDENRTETVTFNVEKTLKATEQ